MSERVFPSKVDAWIVLIMVAAVAGVIVLGFVVRPTSASASLGAFAGAGGIAVLMLAFAVPCRYTLAADALLIRAGLFRQRIAYRDIAHVEASSNPRSAPALSLQRVEIAYAGKTQRVSPRDRELFMTLLRQRVAAARA